MPEIARAMRNGYNLNLLRKLPQVAFLAARKQYVERSPDKTGLGCTVSSGA